MKKQFFFFAFFLMFLFTISLRSQNLISKDPFYKSMSLDPVLTLNNRSNQAIDCVIVDYKVDGGLMMQYKSEGILPANTSVDIALPRIQVKDGLHYFDASVKAANGQSLKDRTFTEGLTFALSPGITVQAGVKSVKSNAMSSTDSPENTSGCSCENGNGLDEDISFWFSMFDDDQNKLDAFGSTTKGRDWIHGKWLDRDVEDAPLSTMTFVDLKKPSRNYRLIVSRNNISNQSVVAEMANMKSGTIQVPGQLMAYPNPFVDRVSIQYEVKQDTEVSLRIVDVQGKLIAQPLSKVKHDTGSYTYQYNNNQLSSGVYQCIVSINGKEQIIKIVKK